MFLWQKQQIDSWLSLTKPINPSEMSYPNKNKLFSSANNVSNTLAPHRPTNSLSKSADDVSNTTLIPRIIGFEQTQTCLVQLPQPLVTPVEIEYKEDSSPISNNNSWSNDNDFPQVTRQNANCWTEDIWTPDSCPYQPVADSNANLAHNWSPTDSDYPQQANSHANLSATPKTDENSNESPSENENESTSPLPSPTEQNAYLGEVFYFDPIDF